MVILVSGNGAFPLDDRSVLEIALTGRPQIASPRDRYVYFPGTAEVPELWLSPSSGRIMVVGSRSMSTQRVRDVARFAERATIRTRAPPGEKGAGNGSKDVPDRGHSG